MPAYGIYRKVSLLFCLIVSAGILAAQAGPNQAGPEIQSLLVQGSQALDRGDNAAAEAAFRRALASEPQSIEILNDLAIALARQNKEAEAIATYRQALKIKPGDAITSRNLAIAYFKAQRYEEALPLLEDFAKATPTFQSTELTGLTLFALDRYSEAAQYLERASQFQPADLQTLDLLEKAYFKAREYRKVADVFARIMAVAPDSASAHATMGMALDDMGREDEAEAEYEAAKRADPNYMGAHSGLGTIYWRQGKFDQAITEFKAELSRYPTDPVSNYLLADILQRQNQTDQAVSYLRAAIAANPKYKEALFLLGKCELTLGRAKEAIGPLEKAVAVDASYYQAHYVLARAFEQVGNTEAATRERRISQEILAKQNAAVRIKKSDAQP